MEYDNTNSGAIFVNDKKTTEKQPDRTGTLNVEGVEYWLSGWLKKDKSGNPFMSLSVKPKQEQQTKPAARTAPSQRNGAPFDDEIPFRQFHAD